MPADKPTWSKYGCREPANDHIVNQNLNDFDDLCAIHFCHRFFMEFVFIGFTGLLLVEGKENCYISFCTRVGVCPGDRRDIYKKFSRSCHRTN